MLRIGYDDGRALGPGKVRLLGLMWETGPISATAQAMGMSRRRAWLLADALTRMFRQAVAIAWGGAALVACCGGMAAAATLNQKLRALVDGMAPPDG